MVQFTGSQNTSLCFDWEDLLELLRDELQEYGGLIGLLNAQQQSILNRRPESLLEINQSVQTQLEASQILHRKRSGFVSNLAENYGQPNSSTLSELVTYFPEVTQPMFQSIIDEINSLISQVRSKIEQNQRLLKRLTEVTDQLLSMADASSSSKVYNAKGDLNRLDRGQSSLNETA